MRCLYFVFCICFLQNLLLAKSAYQIEVSVENYAAKEIYLAYFHGDKQLLKDTFFAIAPAKFLIEGKKALSAGVYVLVLAPSQKRIQFIIPEKDQKFTIKTDSSAQIALTEFQGSKENQLYYEYLKTIENHQKEVDDLQLLIKKDSSNQLNYIRKIRVQDKKLKRYEEKTVEENRGTILAALIQMEWEIEPPKFEGNLEDELDFVKDYMKSHYFDHLDLTASHFLKLPGAYQKVDYFINGLYTAGVNPLSLEYPTAIKDALTIVLDKMKVNRRLFKFYLTHFINKYGKAKIVGMDEVFVHLVDRYVLTGDADWVKGESLKIVTELARKKKPLLNGKIAPNIEMQKKDATTIALHDLEANYILMIFWRPNCGHCKKAIPYIKEFYQAHKAEGVKVFAPCTWLKDKTPKCWDDIQEKEMEDFINVVDPALHSSFLQRYDIKITPKIFLLDKDKRILVKGIAGSQLEAIFQKLKAIGK